MKRLLAVLFALLLWQVPAFASRAFVAASSQRIDLNTSLGNWESTQPFSVAFYFNMASNVSGAILAKEDATANVRGWNVNARAGASTPSLDLELSSVSASARVAVHTTTEFSLNAWHQVIVTYDGTKVVAGINIYVDSGTPQALTTIQNNLGAGTIINAVTSQIGCRGGASPNFFSNSSVRRLALWNVVLSASDITNYLAGTTVPYSTDSTKLLLWQEFGPFNDGATYVADWSGNSNVGAITGATYSATDPTLTALLPNVGTTGVKTLSGPLTKVTFNPPYLQNLGWVNGANNGRSDQIGPGVVIKFGPGDYRGWLENDTGVKSLDVGNQPGAFDFDVPTTYATSPDNVTWTIQSQDTAAGQIFTCNNTGANLTAPQLVTYKAAIHAETSISSLFFDPDDNLWKAWFHGGNNTGPREIYYATNSIDPATANWNVQNTGLPVLSNSMSGWDSARVADFRVIRVSSSLMLGVYRGTDGSSIAQVGLATSTDRGLTWTKYAGNPIIPLGATGAWDAKNTFSAGFAYDAPTRSYVIWYGGQSAAGAAAASIGFISSAGLDYTTWTKGLFNPVLNAKNAASGNNNLEYIVGGTTSTFLDNSNYEIWYQTDNGVGGTTGFRGRQLAAYGQILKGGGTVPSGSLLLLGGGSN